MTADQTIYLVSCTATKRESPAKAKDLYASPWFHHARTYVEATGSRWFILSDKHGLVDPEQVLEPYELAIKNFSASDHAAWAQRVKQQMDRSLPAARRVVILAGKHYREPLRGYLKTRFRLVEEPLARLTIGRQLQWLKQANNRPPPQTTITSEP